MTIYKNTHGLYTMHITIKNSNCSDYLNVELIQKSKSQQEFLTINVYPNSKSFDDELYYGITCSTGKYYFKNGQELNDTNIINIRNAIEIYTDLISRKCNINAKDVVSKLGQLFCNYYRDSLILLSGNISRVATITKRCGSIIINQPTNN